MKTCFIINNIRDGAVWIEYCANDPESLTEYMRRLNGEKSFETPLHIVFGPYSKAEAESELCKLKE